MTCHFKLLPFWKRLVGMTANGLQISECKIYGIWKTNLYQLKNNYPKKVKT